MPTLDGAKIRLAYAAGRAMELWGKARAFLFGVLIGAALAVGGFFWLGSSDPEPGPVQIVTRQISGAPIYHTDIRDRGKVTTFTTTAEGPGVIQTDFPKIMIPEARKWMEAVHGVSALVGYSARGTKSVEGIYSRRWGSAALSGGIRAEVRSGGEIDAALLLGGTYWVEKWFWE